ncbi:MAG: glutamyl-tRNA reductase, partial [Chloroflexota bacterium]
SLCARSLLQLWSSLCGQPQSQFEGCIYHRTGGHAVKHLFKVAAGLDSMVLGEAQILGQVTGAFEVAMKKGLTGPMITDLFRAAIRVGKRSRTETKISHNSLSVSSVAVRFLEKHLDDHYSAKIVVLGAGEMAKLAIKSLKNHSFRSITVVNRTASRARQLAEEWDVDHAPLDALDDLLASADGVVSALSLPQPMINRKRMNGISRSKPLVVADLGVPRNVDPLLDGQDEIFVADMDRLQTVVQEGYAERELEVPRVLAIIEEEISNFSMTEKGHTVRPLISELRNRAEDIRQQELARVYRNLGDVDDAVVQQIELLSRSIINKLLHQPTNQLRTHAKEGRGEDLAEAAKALFQIGVDS